MAGCTCGLPVTGSSPVALLLVAGAFIALGAALIVLRRRMWPIALLVVGLAAGSGVLPRRADAGACACTAPTTAPLATVAAAGPNATAASATTVAGGDPPVSATAAPVTTTAPIPPADVPETPLVPLGIVGGLACVGIVAVPRRGRRTTRA